MAEQVLYEFGGNFQGSAGAGDGGVRGHFKGTLLVTERWGDLDHAVQQFWSGGVPHAGDGWNGASGDHHKRTVCLAQPRDVLGAQEVGIFNWKSAKTRSGRKVKPIRTLPLS